MATISVWLNKLEEVLYENQFIFGMVLTAAIFTYPGITIGLLLIYLTTRIIL